MPPFFGRVGGNDGMFAGVPAYFSSIVTGFLPFRSQGGGQSQTQICAETAPSHSHSVALEATNFPRSQLPEPIMIGRHRNRPNLRQYRLKQTQTPAQMRSGAAQPDFPQPITLARSSNGRKKQGTRLEQGPTVDVAAPIETRFELSRSMPIPIPQPKGRSSSNYSHSQQQQSTVKSEHASSQAYPPQSLPIARSGRDSSLRISRLEQLFATDYADSTEAEPDALAPTLAERQDSEVDSQQDHDEQLPSAHELVEPASEGKCQEQEWIETELYERTYECEADTSDQPHGEEEVDATLDEADSPEDEWTQTELEEIDTDLNESTFEQESSPSQSEYHDPIPADSPTPVQAKMRMSTDLASPSRRSRIRFADEVGGENDIQLFDFNEPPSVISRARPADKFESWSLLRPKELQTVVMTPEEHAEMCYSELYWENQGWFAGPDIPSRIIMADAKSQEFLHDYHTSSYGTFNQVSRAAERRRAIRGDHVETHGRSATYGPSVRWRLGVPIMRGMDIGQEYMDPNPDWRYWLQSRSNHKFCC